MGMWRKETKQYEELQLPNIISFTGNHFLYGAAMVKAVNNWYYSCEHFLSNLSINRKAYIGHCACCIEHSYPEYLVRKAWWMLSEQQRILADNEALKAISLWEQKKKSENIFQHGRKDVTPTDCLTLFP